MSNRPIPVQEQFVSSTHIPPSTPAPMTVISDTSTSNNSVPCPGVTVDWNIEAGSVGWTFPWHRVIQKGAGDAQTEFFRVEIDAHEATRAFSKECRGTTTTELPCSECTKIPRRLLELEDLATNNKPHTNYRYLNYQQIMQLLIDKDSELRRWRLKVSSYLLIGVDTKVKSHFRVLGRKSCTEARELHKKAYRLPAPFLRRR